MKFTKAALAALILPPGKTDHFEWDDDLPGFGVRLRGGSKRWVVQYRFGTQQRRESLGDVRKVKLDDARKIARQRFAQVELGADPAAERAAAAARPDIRRGDRALPRRQAGRDAAETYKAATRYFTVHWKPLHDRAARRHQARRRGRTAAGIDQAAWPNGGGAGAR